MKITLRDFLKLYNFKQIIEDDDHLETKIVRIYYDQPICETDDGRWFEFGVNDHYVTPKKEDIIEKVISKDILNQLVKCVAVVEYDVCNPILRIDTFVCNDSFENDGIEDDKNINTKEETSKNSEEQDDKFDTLSEDHGTHKSKFLTEKQIMFLKGLLDKWKYIVCCNNSYSVCLFMSKPVISKTKGLLYDDDNEYEYMDNLTDKFLFKKDKIYNIEDLIDGHYDGGFALGLYGDYDTSKENVYE